LKPLFKTKILSLVTLTTVIFLSSCDKDKMIPPTIDFTTTTGYTFADTHIALNTAFKIGVDAKRTESKDDLKTFSVTRSYDGTAATTVENLTLTSAQAAEFTKDYNFITRNAAGTEKYTFTVTNKDGLITTKSITITVP
jgi:hypothetical protein